MLSKLEIVDLIQYDEHYHKIIPFLQITRVHKEIPQEKARYFCKEATQYHVVDGVL